MPFHFGLIGAKWDACTLAAMIAGYEAALPSGGWPNWVLGNHDRPRIAARLGEAQARVAAMLLLTLRGTPTVYYGDEIGIGLVRFRRREYRIRASCANRASALAAIPCVRRCRGMRPRTPASPRARPGFH